MATVRRCMNDELTIFIHDLQTRFEHLSVSRTCEEKTTIKNKILNKLQCILAFVHRIMNIVSLKYPFVALLSAFCTVALKHTYSNSYPHAQCSISKLSGLFFFSNLEHSLPSLCYEAETNCRNGGEPNVRDHCIRLEKNRHKHMLAMVHSIAHRCLM